MFDKVAGVSIVDELRDCRPNPGHKQAMMFRRIFFTQEALLRTDREHGTADILGSKGLAKHEQREPFPELAQLNRSADCVRFGHNRVLPFANAFPPMLTSLLMPLVAT